MDNTGSNRPGTVFGLLGSKKFGFASLEREKDLSNQRDILERMVQERDEALSSLQKNIEVKNSHIAKLHSKIEDSERREKQLETRHKVKLDNMINDQNMLKLQLNLMQSEVQRIRSDPIHLALVAQTAAPDESWTQNSTLDNIAVSENDENTLPTEEKEKIKLANHAQGILLQGQLYQAISSLSMLRKQTTTMKENYDAIVKSLQADLTLISDQRAEEEAKLLGQLYRLEKEKKLSVQALDDELERKDSRIQILAEKLKVLEETPLPEGIDEEESGGDYDSLLGAGKDTVPNEVSGGEPKPSPKSKGLTHKDFPFAGKSVEVITNTDKSGDLSTASPVSNVSQRISRPSAGKDVKKNNQNESPRAISDSFDLSGYNREWTGSEGDDDDYHSHGDDTEHALSAIM